MFRIHRSLATNFSLLLATCIGFGGGLVAQCQTLWKTGHAAPGPILYSDVKTTTWWDPDGAGPRGPLLVLGGNFTIPSVGAANLATFDPATGTWGAWPTQPNTGVYSLAVRARGERVGGGAVTAFGPQTQRGHAIWNGTSWTAPGGGVTSNSTNTSIVQSLQAMANGDLVIGGAFTAAGTVAAPGLASWDGSQWRTLGAFSGQVRCLAQRPNGNLVVGGSFPPIGFPGYANIAEWNGTSWIHYSSGLGSNYSFVDALAVLTNGDVVASGFFNIAGGVSVPMIALWNGTAWSAMGTGFEGRPMALLPLANGDLLAASVTTLSQVPVLGVARWDGTQWSSFAPNIGLVTSLTIAPTGNLMASGSLGVPSGEPIRGLATWDGSAWQPMARGFDNEVSGLVSLPNGDQIAFGSFGCAESTAVRTIARWSGQGWWPLTGSSTTMPWVGTPSCATVDGTGTLWMSGSSSGTGGGIGGNVGRWNGTNFVPVGAAIGNVKALVVTSNQQPIVGCETYPSYGTAVARWTGTQWQNYGSGLDGPVRSLLLRDHGTGELIAGGDFLNSGATSVSRIARWNGTAWLPFGPGVDGPVRAIVELPNGELIAAGDFVTDGLRPLNLIARWDGSAWQPLGAGLGGAPGASVRALLVLPNGDLLAGGNFLTAGGYPARGIARWNGSHWQAVAGGVDGTVLALALGNSGEVLAGGNFATAGGRHSAHFARLRTTCPASTTVYGAGCVGSAGLLALESSSPAWLGGTYRATCYGVASNGIGADLFGMQTTQTPLTTLHPAAGSGCLLLTQADAVLLRMPSNGAIESSLMLPNEPALAGLRLHHQVLVAEVDASLAITHLASSNAVTLQLGSF